MTISLARQIACVEREIRMRHRVYARWVQDGRMAQAKADAEIAEMEAVLTTLRAPPDAAPAQGSLLG